MGAEESGEEDKKEVCIQVKLGKEEKTKPSLDRLSLLKFTDIMINDPFFRLSISETSYSSWDPIRATRQNQDIQREVEDTAMFDIQVQHLSDCQIKP